MCGLAGVVDFGDTHPAPPREVITAMVSALRHRGPDEFGLYRDRHAALGHARLSIVDLTSGQQPMANEDGTLWVVFNGEIYNHLELRAELEALGHVFRTRSDTEVLLHAWEAWGEEAFRRFNGQFALALWDTARQELVLARDPFGVRPLYLCEHGGRVYFASEVKALFAGAPDFPRALDPVGLDETFTFWTVVPPQSVFQGVRELEPGHLRRLRRGSVRDVEFWQPRFPLGEVGAYQGSLDDAVGTVRAALEEAVRLRLVRADVPVGSYLSGGLDSSLVAALGRRVQAGRFCTFSLRFEDAEFDETGFQRAVSRRIESEHRELVVSRHDIARVFPDVVAHAERPLLRTAPAPLFLLSRSRARGGAQGGADGRGRRRDVRRLRPVPRGQGAALLGAAARLHLAAPAAGAALPLPAALPGGPAGDGARVLRPRPRAVARRGLRAPAAVALGGGAAAAVLAGRARGRGPHRRGGAAAGGAAGRLPPLDAAGAGPVPRGAHPAVGLPALVAGRPHADGPLGGGPLPLPRPARGGAGQRAAAVAQAQGARREARAQARRRGAGACRDSAAHEAALPRAQRAVLRGARHAGLGRGGAGAEALAAAGVFEPAAVARLWRKARAHQGPAPLSNADDMALVGVLSTQLLHRRFIAQAPEAQRPATYRTTVDRLETPEQP